MAEKKVRFIIERQDGPNEKPYTQEFDVDYRPGLNVVGVQLFGESLRRVHDGHQRYGPSGLLRTGR